MPYGIQPFPDPSSEASRAAGIPEHLEDLWGHFSKEILDPMQGLPMIAPEAKTAQYLGDLAFVPTALNIGKFKRIQAAQAAALSALSSGVPESMAEGVAYANTRWPRLLQSLVGKLEFASPGNANHLGEYQPIIAEGAERVPGIARLFTHPTETAESTLESLAHEATHGWQWLKSPKLFESALDPTVPYAERLGEQHASNMAADAMAAYNRTKGLFMEAPASPAALSWKDRIMNSLATLGAGVTGQ